MLRLAIASKSLLFPDCSAHPWSSYTQLLSAQYVGMLPDTLFACLDGALAADLN